MRILLGFDPGGAGQFGWCLCEDPGQLPLIVRVSGLADHAQQAVSSALSHVSDKEEVAGVGIDAPLFWTADGNRVVDRAVRQAIRKLGAQSPGGTVQHINSLRGACLVQGVVTSLLLRERFPALPVTECHPKAALWLLGIADTIRFPADINLKDLRDYFDYRGLPTSEHERDALFGALSAWAMIHQPPDWRDLFLRERDPIFPVKLSISYWMPSLEVNRKDIK